MYFLMLMVAMVSGFYFGRIYEHLKGDSYWYKLYRKEADFSWRLVCKLHGVPLKLIKGGKS